MISSKNIYYMKGHYCVVKMINGIRSYYACFKNFDDAVKCRDYLVEHNWDKNKLNCTLKSCPKYYTFHHGKYEIKKKINGKDKYYCRCDTEKEAIKIVKYLKSIDWDYNVFRKKYG